MADHYQCEEVDVAVINTICITPRTVGHGISSKYLYCFRSQMDFTSGLNTIIINYRILLKPPSLIRGLNQSQQHHLTQGNELSPTKHVGRHAYHSIDLVGTSVLL